MPDSSPNNSPWLSGPEPNPTPNPAPSSNPTGEIPSYIPITPSQSAQLGAEGSKETSPINDFHGPTSVDQSNTSNPYSISQPPSHDSPYPLHASPKPGRPLKKLYVGILVIILLILGTGSGLAYYKLYYLDALSAPRDFYLNSVNDKTGKFKISTTISGVGSDSPIDIGPITATVAGSYDASDKKNPKFDMTIDGTAANSSFSGQLRDVGDTLYFKLIKLNFLGSVGYKVPNDWYETPLPASTEIKNCDYSSLKDPGSPIDKLTGHNIPIKNASRVGIFETIDGHKTTHYIGEVDFTKLQPYLDGLNSQLPQECQIETKPADFQDFSVNYDFWMANDFNRTKASFRNHKDSSSVSVTVDLYDFNKPVTITPPTNAKSFESLFQNLTPSLSSPSSVSPETFPLF